MEELKASIATQFHLSLRSVNRYLLVLTAPPAVQQAFDRNEITLVNAGKVALLAKKDQQEIARRIAAGEKTKTIIADRAGLIRGAETVIVLVAHSTATEQIARTEVSEPQWYSTFSLGGMNAQDNHQLPILSCRDSRRCDHRYNRIQP